jgi:hypothetical protein
MNFVDLLSQLEESKFLRLFRHINGLPHEGERLGQPLLPLDLPDAELMVKVVGEIGSIRSWVDSWVFQIAHLPSCLWEPAFAENFIEGSLRRAFENLSVMPSPLELLRGHYNTEWSDQVQGYDYYLITNICHDLDDETVSRFSDKAHAVFEDVLKLPRQHHPRFGLGTPETIFSNGGSAVEQFMMDLLNMPSSYYIVAREGRISVTPATEHGRFFASREAVNGASPAAGLSAAVTSTQSHLEVPGLSDFESLLNSPRTKEADLQNFFKEYPHFLFALDERYCEIRPHVCLLDAKRDRLVPDFMARIEDTSVWDVIELKKPQHDLTVRNEGIERISATAARAVAELLQYRDFFSVRANRTRVADYFGTAPYEPSLAVVIGRGRASERYEWRSIRSGFPRVQIVSYDYLFQRAKECSTYLAERRLDARTKATMPI